MIERRAGGVRAAAARARRPRPADDACAAPSTRSRAAARMVGLKAFGEAAWACEQLFNTQLAEQRAAEPPLLEFADWVLGHLGDLGRGHRRASRRRPQRSARSSSPPTRVAPARRDAASAAPTSPCRWACRPACRAPPTSISPRAGGAGAKRAEPRQPKSRSSSTSPASTRADPSPWRDRRPAARSTIAVARRCSTASTKRADEPTADADADDESSTRRST